MKYHLYNLDTGVFTGVSIRGSEGLAIANRPAGQGWVARDFVDHLSEKVDLETGLLVDYQPPAPAADPNQTWSWDSQTRRWVSVPTLASLKILRTSEVQAAIEVQEASQARPQRELLTAFRLSLPAPQAALDRMNSIDAEIVRLRGLRSAIALAESPEALDAVQRPQD